MIDERMPFPSFTGWKGKAGEGVYGQFLFTVCYEGKDGVSGSIDYYVNMTAEDKNYPHMKENLVERMNRCIGKVMRMMTNHIVFARTMWVVEDPFRKDAPHIVIPETFGLSSDRFFRIKNFRIMPQREVGNFVQYPADWTPRICSPNKEQEADYEGPPIMFARELWKFEPEGWLDGHPYNPAILPWLQNLVHNFHAGEIRDVDPNRDHPLEQQPT